MVEIPTYNALHVQVAQAAQHLIREQFDVEQGQNLVIAPVIGDQPMGTHGHVLHDQAENVFGRRRMKEVLQSNDIRMDHDLQYVQLSRFELLLDLHFFDSHDFLRCDQRRLVHFPTYRHIDSRTLPLSAVRMTLPNTRMFPDRSFLVRQCEVRSHCCRRRW